MSIQEELHGDYRIRIEQDEDPTDPREWDNATVFLLQHNRYDLPWEDADAPKDVTLEDLEAWVRETYDDVIDVWQVRGYDHSGFAISLSNSYPFNDRWDSGNVGLVYLRASNVCGTTAEHADEVAKQDVAAYNLYLTGGFVGYIVEKATTCDQGTTHWDLVDSCWGFDDSEYALSEARSCVPVEAASLEDS